MEFKKQLEEKQKDLTIATIYSYAQNEEDTSDGILDDEGFETDLLDKSSREFLDFAINEYNKNSRQISHQKETDSKTTTKIYQIK